MIKWADVILYVSWCFFPLLTSSLVITHSLSRCRLIHSPIELSHCLNYLWTNPNFLHNHWHHDVRPPFMKYQPCCFLEFFLSGWINAVKSSMFLAIKEVSSTYRILLFILLSMLVPENFSNLATFITHFTADIEHVQSKCTALPSSYCYIKTFCIVKLCTNTHFLTCR